GRIDVLVNNAGAIRGGGFLEIPDAQWLDDWSLKLMGYIRMARAVFPIMKAQGGGRIVNVTGAAARNPTATYLTGGAANAALVNFTKGLADLGAECGVLVTAGWPAARRAASTPEASRARRPPKVIRPSRLLDMRCLLSLSFPLALAGVPYLAAFNEGRRFARWRQSCSSAIFPSRRRKKTCASC